MRPWFLQVSTSHVPLIGYIIALVMEDLNGTSLPRGLFRQMLGTWLQEASALHFWQVIVWKY